MNNLRIFLAAVFHFVHPGKTTVKNITRLHKTLLVSAIRTSFKMLHKFFTHELTCQILTNQSIKIGRRAWPTRDRCEKGQKQLPCLPESWLISRVRGQFEIKRLIVQLINTTSSFPWIKKIELEPAIIWKLVTCQRITSKKNSNSVGR